jgi:hypothetical protein
LSGGERQRVVIAIATVLAETDHRRRADHALDVTRARAVVLRRLVETTGAGLLLIIMISPRSRRWPTGWRSCARDGRGERDAPAVFRCSAILFRALLAVSARPQRHPPRRARVASRRCAEHVSVRSGRPDAAPPPPPRRAVDDVSFVIRRTENVALWANPAAGVHPRHPGALDDR